MKNFRLSLLITTLMLITHSARAAGDKAIWDVWYTVTVNGNTHYEYYNDKLEMKKGKLFSQNSLWKQEEGFINEEQLGEFSEDNADLTPLFFNFHGAYRASETIIDATMKGRELNVRVKKETKDLPVVKRNLPGRTFFSQVFPVWLARHLPELQKGKTLSFSTVLEDSIENSFSPDEGSAKLEAADDFAKKTGTHKISTQLRGMTSVWWLKDNGEYLRLVLPEQKAVVERVSAAAAKAFFDSGQESGKTKKIKPVKDATDTSEEG